LSESNYDIIKKIWETEVTNKQLMDLEDLQLSKMTAYLSHVRLSLAETSADDHLKADLLTEEGLNIEFMLRDLLASRAEKILGAALEQQKPTGTMTLVEEEFYNRLTRAVKSHDEFIDDALAGTPAPTIKRTEVESTEEKEEKSQEEGIEDLEYVMVRFLRPVGNEFMGLDDEVYGPFEKEEIATIPTANAKKWLQDGTVSRVVANDLGADE
jgi:DNA replication initiation complex subunit (GINS family)